MTARYSRRCPRLYAAEFKGGDKTIAPYSVRMTEPAVISGMDREGFDRSFYRIIRVRIVRAPRATCAGTGRVKVKKGKRK